MEIKTFGNLSNHSITTSEYVFCLKGVDGDKLYLKGFSVPTICSPLKGQRHEEVKKHFPFLNDLNLNDPESDEVRCITRCRFLLDNSKRKYYQMWC